MCGSRRSSIIEPIELLATDEAVMLRRSYPGIGKRGIGVGYPNQVNLAFDAEQMRLAPELEHVSSGYLAFHADAVLRAIRAR